MVACKAATVLVVTAAGLCHCPLRPAGVAAGAVHGTSSRGQAQLPRQRSPQGGRFAKVGGVVDRQGFEGCFIPGRTAQIQHGVPQPGHLCSGSACRVAKAWASCSSERGTRRRCIAVGKQNGGLFQIGMGLKLHGTTLLSGLDGWSRRRRRRSPWCVPPAGRWRRPQDAPSCADSAIFELALALSPHHWRDICASITSILRKVCVLFRCFPAHAPGPAKTAGWRAARQVSPAAVAPQAHLAQLGKLLRRMAWLRRLRSMRFAQLWAAVRTEGFRQGLHRPCRAPSR